MTAKLHVFGGNGSLIASLNKHGVRFLVVGGLAIKLYAPARNAADLDLLVEPTLANADCILRSLAELHILPGFSREELATAKKLMTLKNHVCYADIVTPDAGFDFQAEWENARTATVNGHSVRVASPDLLIRMKSGSDRSKDLADLQLLSQLASDT